MMPESLPHVPPKSVLRIGTSVRIIPSRMVGGSLSIGDIGVIVGDRGFDAAYNWIYYRGHPSGPMHFYDVLFPMPQWGHDEIFVICDEEFEPVD